MWLCFTTTTHHLKKQFGFPLTSSPSTVKVVFAGFTMLFTPPYTIMRLQFECALLSTRQFMCFTCYTHVSFLNCLVLFKPELISILFVSQVEIRKINPVFVIYIRFTTYTAGVKSYNSSNRTYISTNRKFPLSIDMKNICFVSKRFYLYRILPPLETIIIDRL